jgi:trimeric autotransporter adhesin
MRFNEVTMTQTIKKSLIVLGFALLVAGAFVPAQAHASFLEDVLDPFGLFHDGNLKPPLGYILDDGGSSGSSSSGRLGVSCRADRTAITEGESVRWTATPTGGNGRYGFTWEGTDNLNSASRSVSKVYNDTGYKDARVTVTSGRQTITKNCNNRVYVSPSRVDDDDDDDNNYSDLRVSCYPSDEDAEVGDRITWRVNASGGGGDYDYDWSGSEGLDGDDDEVSIRYDDEGTKRASVTVESRDGQEETESCGSVDVDDDYDNDDNDDDDDDDYYGNLGGTCYATPASIEAGDTVTWGASAWGGNGDYRYTWSGTDSFSATGRYVNVRYDNPGTKSATLRITSGSRSKVISCENTVSVYGDTIYDNPISSSLQVSCTPSLTSAAVGRQIVWSANVYGGSGNYSYTWTGTDGVRSSQSTLATIYDAPGTKYATLTVRSGNQTVTRACTSPVTVSFTSTGGGSVAGTSTTRAPLEVTCFPSEEKVKAGQMVTWEAVAEGGTGTYKYSWSGSDNLRGTQDMVNKKYPNKGPKFAMLTVTSGSQNVSVACDGIVEVGNTGLAALALFGDLSWGLVSILLILILLIAIGYLLYNRSKI